MCDLKKSVSMKNEKGAEHGTPPVERGEGGIMTEKLVYNRAYKRIRLAELKKGSSNEWAKKVAAHEARNAVEFFSRTRIRCLIADVAMCTNACELGLDGVVFCRGL